MITQFVNQIEQHPESLFAQAAIAAQMKRDSLSDVTKRFRAIQTFWRKVSVHQPAVSGNVCVQCEG